MGRHKGSSKPRRKHQAADAKFPGRVRKQLRKNPSWLPRRSKPDPVLTSSIRRFLNRQADVIYYSDSTETLNVQVKRGTSRKSQKQLGKDLTEELKKGDRPQRFTIEEGRPYVLCSDLPLDLEAVGDQLMRRKVGVYLRVRPTDGSDDWAWYLISVYHLVHRICRQMEDYRLNVTPWPSPFFRSHPLDVQFRQRRHDRVDQYDVLSHPAMQSVAVLDAKRKDVPQEVLDDEGQAANFYNNHYFSVDILAVPVKHELKQIIGVGITKGDLVRVGILTVPLPATDELPPGKELLALGASKGHVPYKGSVVEATGTSELELKYSDQDTDTYDYENLLSYRFPRWGNHEPDDCGTPIFTKDGGEMKLLAFHIARRDCDRSGMGFYAFHSINAVFSPDIWEVEAYAPMCVTDPDSAYYSGSLACG